MSKPEILEHHSAGQGVAFQATREPDRALDLCRLRRDHRSPSADLDGRIKVPDFHQSGQHPEHSSAGRRAGDRRGQHDHGDDIRRHRSLGRHAGLAGVDRRGARDIQVGPRRRSIDRARRRVGNRPREHHGVHHFENPHRTVHHHARRNDLVSGDRVAAQQLARGRDEGRTRLSHDKPHRRSPRPGHGPGPARSRRTCWSSS